MTANVHESTLRARRYRRHIIDLCRAFGLFIRPIKDPTRSGAGMTRSKRRRGVFLTPVIDESTYAVALHEIGHCLSPLGMITHTEGSLTMRRSPDARPATRRDVLLQLEEEYAAWEWAHHNAIEWTPLMAQIEMMSRGSYEGWARAMGAIE